MTKKSGEEKCSWEFEPKSMSKGVSKTLLNDVSKCLCD